ncbi:MAG: haloacid dehalogenase type II [Gammaproteobacteria bacterium]|nr:haloacid dehalogenase type II [Gammaproteobacteria bacterium]
MAITLGFDIYGTLIDPHGVTVKLGEIIDDRAAEFSQLWRTKQLEYTFRRGLMRDYENFVVVTRNALDYADQVFNTNISEADKQALMASYRVLPAYDDVPAALQKIRAAGFRLYGFSNGIAEAVSGLLEHAGIAQYFDGVVSVDEIGTYKPNPDVYQHFVESTGSDKNNAWLVSSNPFDVQGAINIGMKAAWLHRFPEVVFDPWGIEPTIVMQELVEIVDRVK